ncbi:MAG: DUF6600 domain-containing protein [Candidatus Acidiferrum sp.]
MLKTNSNGKGRVGLLLCLAGLLCFAAPNARAGQGAPDQAPPDQAAPDQDQAPQDQIAPNDANDPPTRVARISYLDGSVSIQPGGVGDWGAAALNRPMTIGDKLWTDKDSRVELQTGVVSMHLGSMTALSFLNLNQAITQMRIAEGSINFRVKEIREGDVYEVDTPNATFTVTKAGAFRIDVNENGDSTGISVIRGEGQVVAGGKTTDLQPGQRGVFDGTNEVQSTVAQAPPPDGLDQWANDRDLREQDSVSAQYVPPDMPGAADLDNNGDWSEQPDVGPVWYPNDVGPDWAPYSAGNWSYIGPWGWTWVGYEPWGFAPYHYGRWGYYGGRWGWCPGPRVGFAVYGPAFVGFLGGGFGFGVGWFPLGWGEPYHPWYHAGFGYWNRINVHNTYIRNANVIRGGNYKYAYAHNVHAVTATSRGAFTGGERINRGAAHITEASLRGAQVTNHVGFSPTHQSSFGAANARGNVARPPSSVQNRSVMARTAPAAGASHMSVRAADSNGLRTANNSRSWSAQGNTTDRGRAPEGFGSSSRGSSEAMSARTNRTDRPPWAGAGASANNGASRATGDASRETYSRGGGAYNSSQRSAPSTNRGYTAPSRSYSAPNRTYSAPSRTYSAPSRTYSAPSRSYGGGSSHAGGGGAPHGGGGGGGSPHGGGGGGGHPHR